MKEVIKWNFKTNKYEEYTITGNTILMCNDMNKSIDCACCGKSITFGDSYTSRQIHNKSGFGYPVCEECYNKELEEARKWK